MAVADPPLLSFPDGHRALRTVVLLEKSRQSFETGTEHSLCRTQTERTEIYLRKPDSLSRRTPSTFLLHRNPLENLKTQLMETLAVFPDTQADTEHFVQHCALLCSREIYLREKHCFCIQCRTRLERTVVQRRNLLERENTANENCRRQGKIQRWAAEKSTQTEQTEHSTWIGRKPPASNNCCCSLKPSFSNLPPSLCNPIVKAKQTNSSSCALYVTGQPPDN